MKIGLCKLAEENQSEIIQPEEKETGVSLICNSDCKYSQNPEKLCLLSNVALAMGKPGEFVCSQYNPVEMQEEVAEDRGQAQSNRQMGLAGAKTKV